MSEVQFSIDTLQSVIGTEGKPQPGALDRSAAIAVRTNPDEFARYNALAKQTGMDPFGMVESKDAANEAERRAKWNGFVGIEDHPHTAKFLTNPVHAALAQDDLAGLSGIERALYRIGEFEVGTAKSIASAIPRFNEGAWGIVQAAADVLPESIGGGLSAKAAGFRKSQKDIADAMMPKSEGLLAASWYSGMQSLGLNVLNLPLGLGGKLAPMLTSMGLTTGGSSYGQARDAGQSVPQALAFGTSQGVIEAGTEMLGMPALLSMFKPGSFGKKALEYMVKEQAGEQIATHLQDLNEWAILHPDQSFDAYLKERPNAALQTALATAFSGGGQVAVMKGLQLLAGHEAQASSAEDGAAQLADAMRAIASSKLKTRDASTLQAFVQSVADANNDGQPDTLFISPVAFDEALQQSGIAMDAVPSAYVQYVEARQNGGDMEIPTGELLTAFSGTGAEQAIVQHIRMAPAAATLAEVQADAGKAAEFFRAEADRIVTESERTDQWNGSAQEVEDFVAQQLEATGMRHDEARSDAQLHRAFATVMADKYSRAGQPMLPKDFFDRHTLRVMGGQGMGQSFSQRGYAPDELLAIFAEANTINTEASEAPGIPRMSEEEANAAEFRFLSTRPKGETRYTRKSGLLKRVRRSSEAIADELRGSAETAREVADGALGPFSGYRVEAEIIPPDEFYNPGGTLKVRIFGKEQIDAGLTAEPALIFTVTADGELSVNGPNPDGPTFKEFNSRGWADYAQGAGGDIAKGWSVLRDPSRPGAKLPLGQSTPLLADVHSRVREWRGQDMVGLHWSRSTGAIGGLFSPLDAENGSNAFFQFADEFNDRASAPRAAFNPTTAYEVSDASGKAIGFATGDSSESAIAEFNRANKTDAGKAAKQTPLISLLADANASSFLHESGHFFLSVYADVASDPNAPAEIMQDMSELLQWFGIEAAPEMTALERWQAMTLDEQRPYHERFAESFEQYLFEGKAPSLELQPLFRKFASWMKRVYRSVQDFIGVNQLAKMDETVSSIFDRMLATDEEIDAATAARNYVALFKTAEEGGMTPDEWADYQATNEDSVEEAREELTARALRELKWSRNLHGRVVKELQKDARAARAVAEMDARREVMTHPVYRAWQFLTGKPAAVTAEQTPDDDNYGKLSLEGLKSFPDEIAEHIRKLRMSAKEGLHPDVVAELFGFASGDEMVRTLAAAPTPKEAIAAEADRIMLDRYSELATPEAISQAADEAIHNEVRAKSVATELLHLKKEVGSVPLLLKAAKEYAVEIVGRKLVRDVKPHVFAAAESRAAKAAEKALTKGDREQAAKDKRAQLLNGVAAKEAHAVRREIQQALRYFRRVAKSKTLAADYREQINALLGKYDLSTGNGQTALRTWVQSRLNAGEIPNIAESLLSKRERMAYIAAIEARDESGELIYPDDEQRILLLADAIDRSTQQPYQTMSVDEFRGLVDTVKGIEHLGRLKNKLLTERDNRTYQEVRDAIAGSIVANAKNQGKNTRTANDWIGKKWQAIKQFGASHIKTAIWARIMDGGKDNGPVWRYVIMPANERATWESSRRAAATESLGAILRPILSDVPVLDKIGKGRYFDSLGESLNWEERFAIALNYGNESNLQRLLGGRGWTIGQVMPVLRSLSAREWAAVQAVWDHFESYRPEIAAKERRVSGAEPQWIAPRPFAVATADGQTVSLRGGYYPVIFDPRVNMKAGQQAAAEEAQNLLKAAYSAATTRRSFTKSRVEAVNGRPLLLNLQGLYSGVNDVIHDLAWHEWVIDANKLLKSTTIDSAIREHYGPEVKKEFEKWRDDIVAGTRRLDHGIEKAASWARQGVSAAGLTYNVMSAAIQPLGLTQSIARIGAAYVGRGVARYVGNPVATTKEAVSKSDWMANRSRTRFRELNELRNKVSGQSATREVIGHYGYWMMMRTQQMVDVITWWGGYEKAAAEGHATDEATLIALADQAVKDSQGGGEEVDQSGIERGGPLIKLFTVFYSFMNTGANMGYLSAKTDASKAKVAANMLLLYWVPAVLGSLLRNGLTPGDSGDDDKWLKKMMADQIGYLVGLIAFGREFDLAIKSLFGEAKGQGYSGPAGLRLIPDTVKLTQQAVQGEFDDAFRKAFINEIGDLTGLPSAQVNRSITGIKALREGETSNPAAVVLGYQKPH